VFCPGGKNQIFKYYLEELCILKGYTITHCTSHMLNGNNGQYMASLQLYHLLTFKEKKLNIIS
jgi:hypothetical protein